MTPHGSAQANYAEANAGFGAVEVWNRETEGRLRTHSRDEAGRWQATERACRVLNVLVATVSIIIAAPVFLVVALLVRLTSRGPVIFRQERVGVDRRRRGSPPPDIGCLRKNDRGGRIFTIYKFRTMRVSQDTPQVWASRTDPRVTPVGKFLRATRLDELPQLFNVLKGDMNIVGPRPEQPEIFRELSGEITNYRERQRVLPGITGLAQVNLGYDASIEDVKRKVAMDLEYIEERSALTDIAIMAKTVPVMIFQKVWM